METNTDTHQLAAEAIEFEGAAAYFPGCDWVSDALAASILGRYLAENPTAWTPAGDDSGWSFDGSLDALAEMAASYRDELLK